MCSLLFPDVENYRALRNGATPATTLREGMRVPGLSVDFPEIREGLTHPKSAASVLCPEYHPAVADLRVDLNAVVNGHRRIAPEVDASNSGPVAPPASAPSHCRATSRRDFFASAVSSTSRASTGADRGESAGGICALVTRLHNTPTLHD